MRTLGTVVRLPPTSWLVLAVLAACQGAPPPLALPAVTPQLDHRPVGGETGGEPATAALRVTIERLALRPGPAGPAADLAARTIATDRGLPFRGASSLPAGSRWLTGAELDAWLTGRGERQSRGIAEAVIAEDLFCRARTGDELPELELRATGAATVQVIGIRTAADGTRERLELQPMLAPGEAAMLFVPVDPSRGYGGDALLVTVLDPAQPALAAAVRASARAAAAAEAAAAPDTAPSWQLAQRSIGEHNRRPALLAVAHELGSPRALDLLLDADERTLIAITEQLATLPAEATTATWPFERELLRALLPQLERDELGAALQAGVRRQLGAVADDAGTLRQLLASSADCPAFAAALRDENLAALADRTPAVRVAAHDWLLQHGGSVNGFEPLAPASQRKQALRAHAVAEAARDATAEAR